MRHSVFWRLWGADTFPGQLENSAGTTRTGSVSAFPGQLELDRFKDAAVVGVGVGEVAEGSTGLRDNVKNFLSGGKSRSKNKRNGGGSKYKQVDTSAKTAKLYYYDIMSQMMVDQDRKWLYTFPNIYIQTNNDVSNILTQQRAVSKP